MHNQHTHRPGTSAPSRLSCYNSSTAAAIRSVVQVRDVQCRVLSGCLGRKYCGIALAIGQRRPCELRGFARQELCRVGGSPHEKCENEDDETSRHRYNINSCVDAKCRVHGSKRNNPPVKNGCCFQRLTGASRFVPRSNRGL